MTDTRSRILEALRVVLIRDGSAAVTLEAVAAEALVSKGGLLYHFPSKQALFDGLYLQLAERSKGVLSNAPKGAEPTARRYLEMSTPTTAEKRALYSSILATFRSADCPSDGATAELRELFAQWTAPLKREVTDPVLAATIRLVGDGIFFNELLGLPPVPPAVLVELIDRLLAQLDVQSTT
jgi:AcrR family transcriptional regulator